MSRVSSALVPISPRTKLAAPPPLRRFHFILNDCRALQPDSMKLKLSPQSCCCGRITDYRPHVWPQCTCKRPPPDSPVGAYPCTVYTPVCIPVVRTYMCSKTKSGQSPHPKRHTPEVATVGRRVRCVRVNKKEIKKSSTCRVHTYGSSLYFSEDVGTSVPGAAVVLPMLYCITMHTRVPSFGGGS